MMTKIKLLTTKEINAVIEQIEQIKSIAEYDKFWFDFEFQYDNYPRQELGAITIKFNDMINEKASESYLAEFLSKRILWSRAEAGDPQYWITLNFIYFSKYIRSLYEDKSDDVYQLKSNLKNHFIHTSSQGSLLKGPISGLWWAAKITVLPMHDYSYTYKFLKQRNLRFKNLGSHQIIRHQPALFALLDFLDENSELKVLSSGNLLGTEVIAQAMSKALNQVAGTRLISVFDQNEINTILQKYKSYIIKLAIDIHKGKRGVTEEDFYDIEETQSAPEVIDENKEEPLTQDSNEYQEFIEDTRPNEFYEIEKPLPTVVGQTNIIQHHKDFQIDRYFLYNKYSRQYKISKYDNDDFDVRIGFSSKRQEQVLLHFYKQGKINRTIIGSSITTSTLDYLYSNGSNRKLELLDIQIVTNKFLIAIAYKSLGVIYHKLYREDILKQFNQDLQLEGKQLMEKGSFDFIAYKIIPYEFINEIDQNRVYSSSTAKGIELTNRTYDQYWQKLKKYWPELFTNSLFED